MIERNNDTEKIIKSFMFMMRKTLFEIDDCYLNDDKTKTTDNELIARTIEYIKSIVKDKYRYNTIN